MTANWALCDETPGADGRLIVLYAGTREACVAFARGWITASPADDRPWGWYLAAPDLTSYEPAPADILIPANLDYASEIPATAGQKAWLEAQLRQHRAA
jgi:hypothetical protein